MFLKLFSLLRDLRTKYRTARMKQLQAEMILFATCGLLGAYLNAARRLEKLQNAAN